MYDGMVGLDIHVDCKVKVCIGVRSTHQGVYQIMGLDIISRDK